MLATTLIAASKEACCAGVNLDGRNVFRTIAMRQKYSSMYSFTTGSPRRAQEQHSDRGEQAASRHMLEPVCLRPLRGEPRWGRKKFRQSLRAADEKAGTGPKAPGLVRWRRGHAL